MSPAQQNAKRLLASLVPRALQTRTGRRVVVVAYYTLLSVTGLFFVLKLDWPGTASLCGVVLCFIWLLGLSVGSLDPTRLDERQQLERLKTTQGAFSWMTGVVFSGYFLLRLIPSLNAHLRVDLQGVLTFLFACVTAMHYSIAVWSESDPLEQE